MIPSRENTLDLDSFEITVYPG